MPDKVAVVVGTGFKNPDGSDRASIVRAHVKPDLPVRLVREHSNKHDPNAIAVYIPIPRFFGLLGQSWRQIGYVRATAADKFAALIDAGTRVTAVVTSYYAPSDRDHPRVSIRLSWPKV